VNHAIACYILLLLSPAAQTPAQKPEPPLSAQDILKRMANRYASCQSYRDSGSVTVFFIQSKHTEVIGQSRFTTAFRRPDRFRFECQPKWPDQPDRYILWTHGDDVRVWPEPTPAPQGHLSLAEAVVGAVNASKPEAYFIPTLLMMDRLKATTLAELGKPERLEDAKLGEVDCFRVQGSFAGWPTTLWIDKATFVVWQVNHDRDLGAVRAETTVTYFPVLDAELDDKELDFNPPPAVPESTGPKHEDRRRTPGWLQEVEWTRVVAGIGIVILVLILVVGIRRALSR
jgi:outer membrane lipoprotein-sorting protein